MRKLLLICALSLGFITTQAQVPTLMRISDAADSVVLKAFADISTRSVCFQIKDFRPDSIIVDDPKTMQVNKEASKCEGFNGLIAFVRDTAETPRNIDFLNGVILEQYPYFIMVCGGSREGPGWTTVPECRVRMPLPKTKEP